MKYVDKRINLLNSEFGFLLHFATPTTPPVAILHTILFYMVQLSKEKKIYSIDNNYCHFFTKSKPGDIGGERRY
jgi:hypothetical protein